MSLWPILITLTALVLALVLLPLLRRPGAPAARREYDLSVYRAQLEELESDEERGLLGPDEARAARLEVERRMLAADAEGSVSSAPGWHRRPRAFRDRPGPADRAADAFGGALPASGAARPARPALCRARPKRQR